jgi:hypothetical protein
MPSIEIPEIFLHLYVWKNPVTKIKIKDDGEVVFITKEYKRGDRDGWGHYSGGEWVEVEHSIDEVMLRTKIPEEDD